MAKSKKKSAKKKSTKPVKKPSKPMKKAVKKAAKPAPKKAPAKRAAKPAPSPNPFPISTGSGPSPSEVGADLVAMFNQGQMQAIEDKWYSPNIVSVEGVGVSMGWRGHDAVRAKSEQWAATHKIHGASAEGPYVGATGFSVKFTMDLEDTEANQRSMMEEVGVYEVRDGKIVREEFMYSTRKA